MLAVLFAVCYQSVHTFSHEHHLKTECCDDSHHLTFKTSEKTFTESDDCPVCDFKFAAFLSPEVFHFDFIPSSYEIPINSTVLNLALRLKEIRSTFVVHLFLWLK